MHLNNRSVFPGKIFNYLDLCLLVYKNALKVFQENQWLKWLTCSWCIMVVIHANRPPQPRPSQTHPSRPVPSPMSPHHWASSPPPRRAPVLPESPATVAFLVSCGGSYSKSIESLTLAAKSLSPYISNTEQTEKRWAFVFHDAEITCLQWEKKSSLTSDPMGITFHSGKPCLPGRS